MIIFFIIIFIVVVAAFMSLFCLCFHPFFLTYHSSTGTQATFAICMIWLKPEWAGSTWQRLPAFKGNSDHERQFSHYLPLPINFPRYPNIWRTNVFYTGCCRETEESRCTEQVALWMKSAVEISVIEPEMGLSFHLFHPKEDYMHFL